MMSKNDARTATVDLINAIREIFKKYTRETRIKSWKDGIESVDGKEAINKLIKNPSVPLIGIYRYLKFKEWLNQNSN